MDDDDDLDGDYDNYEDGVMMGRQPREITNSNGLQVFHYHYHYYIYTSFVQESMIDESLADMTTLGDVPHSAVSTRGGGRRSTRGGRQSVATPQRGRRYAAGQHQ